MKGKQYFISTKDGKVKVMGYPVVIPGYEEFSFFAHRPHGYYNGKNNPPCFSNSSWTISEAITGLNLMPYSWDGGMSDSTRAGALAIVIEQFKSLEADHILPRFQSAIKATRDEAARVRTRQAIDEVAV